MLPTFKALAADAPLPALAEHLQLFGWLTGSWEFDWTGHAPDGSTQQARGEWHFAWILEGRAIQDVWIVPSRQQQRLHNLPVIEYGTAVRFYDPKIDAWRMNWSGPLKGRALSFIARKEGDEIVIEGKNEHELPLRWIFSHMTPQSFHWRALYSEDDGKHWQLQQEMDVWRTPDV